jgi:hypothetical protein
MVGTVRTSIDSNNNIDTVNYAYGSAVVANKPIYVAGLGALVPQVSADASISVAYARKGQFEACVTNGTAVVVGSPVYYNTSTDRIQLTVPAAGFYLGVAVEAATGNSGGTVFAGVAINENPETIAKIFSSTDIADTAPTLTAAQVYGGVIYGAIVSARTATLCSAADLYALVPGARVGSSVVVSFINNGADTDALTVGCPASITNKGLAGHLAVAQNTAKSYRIVFTSATAADLYPM